MYSYEERIRAVTLYIKLGKRTGATIRQLGYPLKSWHEEYERRLDLPSGYVRSMPKYSQTQKERAVEHYAEHGHCIAATGACQGSCRLIHARRGASSSADVGVSMGSESRS